MFPVKNPLTQLEKVPPFLAHALARKRNGRERIPLDEIVARSGLSERTYLRTARKDSWDGVKFSVIKGFLLGAGVDPWRMKNQLRYLRDHNFQFPYLTAKQKRVMDEICAAKLKPESETPTG
jgi:hypothetical protein